MAQIWKETYSSVGTVTEELQLEVPMWRLEEYGIFTQFKQQKKQVKKMTAGHLKQVAKQRVSAKVGWMILAATQVGCSSSDMSFLALFLCPM